MNNKIIGLQCDPLNKGYHSYLSLMIASDAITREMNVFQFSPSEIYLDQGKLFAKGREILVKANLEGDHEVCFKQEKVLKIDDLDIVLIRQNPPVDMSYLTNLHLLENFSSTRKINSPKSIKNFFEKVTVLELKDYAHPESLIASDLNIILEFINKHKKVILKPLFEFGGLDIFLLSKEDPNLLGIIDIFFRTYKGYFLLQPFIEDVLVSGDNRLYFIDGKFICGFKRIPSGYSIKGNMLQGARPEAIKEKDFSSKMIGDVGAFLKQKEIFFAGVDVIGSYITEINVTSPGAIRQAYEIMEINLAKIFWDNVFKY